MKPTIWVRSAEVATGLDTNQKGAQTTQVHHPPKPSLDIPWFCFYLLQLSTTQITQPTSHWAWLFFKPSATWMHPSVPKSVNRTSCPAAFYDPNFVETFGACVRLMGKTPRLQAVTPCNLAPTCPNPPTRQGSKNWSTGCCRKTSARAVAPHGKRYGKSGKSWGVIGSGFQKRAGFFGGGSNLSTKDSQLFQTTWTPKEQIEHSSPKGLFFGGGQKSVNVKTTRKKNNFSSTFEPITRSTCGSDGVQLHDQLCQRLIVLQAIEECDRTWRKKPGACYQKVSEPLTPNQKCQVFFI